MDMKKQQVDEGSEERAPEHLEGAEASGEETPLILASSNPRVVRVTLEAQGTLLYNAEKKFALE